MSSISNQKANKKNFKVVLLGNSAVGKTALIERFTHNKFENKENPTIGIDFVGKNITINGHTFRLQLWDTAGQERYRSLIPSYLKDAVSAVFVFDITNNESLNDLQSWIQLYKQNKSDKSIIVACGNKMDLKQQQSYSEIILKQITDKYKMKIFFVSALTGEGVNEMFQQIINLAHSQQEKKKKKFDESHFRTEPYSSQNLHAEEMNSNRSNHSNQIKNEQQSGEKPTSYKIRTEDIKIKNKGSTEQLNKQGNDIQGGNRCC